MLFPLKDTIPVSVFEEVEVEAGAEHLTILYIITHMRTIQGMVAVVVGVLHPVRRSEFW